MNRIQTLRRDLSKSTEDNSSSGMSKPVEKKKKKGLLSLFHRKKSSKRNTVQFGNAGTQTMVSAVPELSEDQPSPSRSSSISPERYILDHRRLSERGGMTSLSQPSRNQVYSSSCDQLAATPSIPETDELGFSHDARYSSMMDIPESRIYDRSKSTSSDIAYVGKMSKSSADVSSIEYKYNRSYMGTPRDENLSNSTTSEISRAASVMEMSDRPVAPVRRKKSLRGLSTQHAPNFQIRAESYAVEPMSASGTGGYASCSVPDVRGSGNLERRHSHTSSHSSGFDEAYSSQSNYDVNNGDHAGVSNGNGVATKMTSPNTVNPNSGSYTADRSNDTVATIADSAPTTSTDTLVATSNTDTTSFVLSAADDTIIMKAGCDTAGHDSSGYENGLTVTSRMKTDGDNKSHITATETVDSSVSNVSSVSSVSSVNSVCSVNSVSNVNSASNISSVSNFNSVMPNDKVIRQNSKQRNVIIDTNSQNNVPDNSSQETIQIPESSLPNSTVNTRSHDLFTKPLTEPHSPSLLQQLSEPGNEPRYQILQSSETDTTKPNVDRNVSEKDVTPIDLAAQDKVHEDLIRTLAASFDDLTASKFFDIEPIHECDSNTNKLKSHKSPHVSFIDISDSTDQRFDRFVKDKNTGEDRTEDTTSYKVFLEKTVSPTRQNRHSTVQRSDSSLTRRAEVPYTKNHRQTGEVRRTRSGNRYLSDVSKMFERNESVGREISPARSESHLFVKADDFFDSAEAFHSGYNPDCSTQSSGKDLRLSGLLKGDEMEPIKQSESFSSLIARCPLNNRGRQTEPLSPRTRSQTGPLSPRSCSQIESLSPHTSSQTETLSPRSDKSSGSESLSAGRTISSPRSSTAPVVSPSYQKPDDDKRTEHSGRSRNRNNDRYRSNISMKDVQAALHGANSGGSSTKGLVLPTTKEVESTKYSPATRPLGKSDHFQTGSITRTKNIDGNAMDRIFGKQENIEKVPGYISPHDKCIYVDIDKGSEQNLSGNSKLEDQDDKSAPSESTRARDENVPKENSGDFRKYQGSSVKYSSAMELSGSKNSSSGIYNSTDELSSRYGVTSVNDVTPGMKQRQRLMERMRNKPATPVVPGTGIGSTSRTPPVVPGTSGGSNSRTRRTFQEQSADLKDQYSRIYKRLMETPESGSNLRKSESWNAGFTSSNDRLFTAGTSRKSYDQLDSIDESSHSKNESFPKYTRNNNNIRSSTDNISVGVAPNNVNHSRQRLIDRRIPDSNLKPVLSLDKCSNSDAANSHTRLFRSSTYDVTATPEKEANSKQLTTKYAATSQTGSSSNNNGLIGLITLKRANTASVDNLNRDTAQNYYRPHTGSSVIRSNSSHSTMSPSNDYIAAKRERNPVLKSILKKSFDRSFSSDDSVFASSPIVKSSGSYQLPVVREINTNQNRLDNHKELAEVKPGGTYSSRYYQMTMSPSDQRNNLGSSRSEGSSKYSTLPNYQRPR